MRKKLLIITGVVFSVILLSACNSTNNNLIDSGMMGGGGMMGNSDMMQFHMATIPEPYNGLDSPVPADDDSIFRGQTLYTTHCAVCHGDGGMGDGPAGVSLDPSPARIAHTSQMLSDGYLYWRITEGGNEFGTAMTSFKGILSDDDRWDVINYVRALGSNAVMPFEQFGGEVNDPAVEATQQAGMLADAVSQGIISQEEAQFFEEKHKIVDDFILNNRSELSQSEKPMMESGLDALVENGSLTENDADLFIDIHNRLVDAKLMQ